MFAYVLNSSNKFIFDGLFSNDESLNTAFKGFRFAIAVITSSVMLSAKQAIINLKFIGYR